MAAVISLFLALACAPGEPSPPVVLAWEPSPRVALVLAGLEEELGRGPLKVIYAQGSPDRMREELRRINHRRPRLLVVLGTKALMVAAREIKRTPLVFALAANPYFTGAAYEPGHPELHQENLTGLASPPPVREALEQGARLLGAKTWGMLYDPDDGWDLELAGLFQEIAAALGLKGLVEASPDPASDQKALERLLTRGARVIYLPPAVSALRYTPELLAWGRQGRVLVVSSHPELQEKGAVLRVILDYRDLGRETARLARAVLAGAQPAGIPIKTYAPVRPEVDEALLRRWSGYPKAKKE